MSQKQYPLTLSESEICHLVALLVRNEEDGEHTRPAAQYWARARRIEQKLAEALSHDRS